MPRSATAMRSLLVVAVDSRLRGNNDLMGRHSREACPREVAAFPAPFLKPVACSLMLETRAGGDYSSFRCEETRSA
jgi:hypothetical protein